ncbi:hypothetical protein K469DRAFT_687434 [Zopfia rhizophila CBS 207.26]|uniref:Nephrocystin 3-like N-terminal domain-containing protein n=1 Tax=Zopfia rhizophila CBS 207.26 TaxID=1314779 RepID=A0A6A6E2I9_9PEZI|nr:hypothetical protein K469DRAFT_687434 [Zopfia rhizophila CBS 207.26]
MNSLGILRSLMHQLLLCDEVLFYHTEEAFRKNSKESLDSFYSLLPVFLTCLAKTEAAYVIMDGLDELNDTTLSDLFGGFQMWLDACPDARVRLLITSRWSERIECGLTQAVHWTKRKDNRILSLKWRPGELTYRIPTFRSKSLISDYVTTGIQSLASLKAAQNAGLGVIRRICDAADGHWLYARFLLEDSKRQPTLARLKERLETLPKGLTELYSQILNDSEHSFDGEDLHFARTIYSWVCLARVPKPMTVQDIGVLLSLKPGSTSINQDAIPLDA